MYSINGVSLNAPAQGLELVKGTLFKGEQTEHTRSSMTLPGRHGAIFGRAGIAAPVLQLVVAAKTPAAANRLDALLNMANLTITRARDGATADVILQTTKTEQKGMWLNGEPREFHVTINLQFPGAAWRGDWQTFNVGETMTAMLGVSAPLTDALISVQSPGSNFRLMDMGQPNDSYVGYSGPGADWLLIDTAKQRAWASSSQSWNPTGTQVTQHLVSGPNPYALELRPYASGTTSYYQIGYSGNAGLVQMRARPAYNV